MLLFIYFQVGIKVKIVLMCFGKLVFMVIWIMNWLFNNQVRMFNENERDIQMSLFNLFWLF